LPKSLTIWVGCTKADTCPWSAASRRSLKILIRAVSVLWNCRYADWNFGMASLLVIWCCSWFWTTLSSNLDRNGPHSFSACLAVTATSGSAVEDVDWRTSSTFLEKKVANSSAVWPLELLVFFVSPIMLDRVRHSFLLSPLLSSMLVRQYNLFFCSYSRRSDFDCVSHDILSASWCVFRNRRSAALTRRRKARHSASNHGVSLHCFFLVVTSGQCLSRSDVISVSWRATRSSGDRSAKLRWSAQSLDAARSASKSAAMKFRQLLRVTSWRNTAYRRWPRD